METTLPQSRFVYFFSFVLPLIAIAGNLTGGWSAFSGFIAAFMLYPLLDIVLGESQGRNLESDDPFFFDLVLYIHAILQIAAVGTLCYFAAHQGLDRYTLMAALSTGTNSGISSIVIAHELIHRKTSFQRYLGIFLLGTVNYMHFYVEHIRGHHKNVATDLDPASAKEDEGLWGFVLRTIPRQWESAFDIMKEKNVVPLKNTVVLFLLAQIVSWFCMYFVFGRAVLAAWLIQSLFSIFLLEFVNYIRHWGLRRVPGEKVQAWHSWQSEQRWSRWTLVELTRHSDHHMIASREYWKLQGYAEGPRLPGGYYVCFYLALIPPLWRSVMQKRITATKEND